MQGKTEKMNFEHAKSLVIIPFGAGRDPALLADTIESVQYHFKTGSVRVAVINDSGHNLQSKLNVPSETVTIYPSRYETTARTGETRYAALLVNTLEVISTEQRKHSFDVAVKMDDDTLVCGDDPHLPAMNFSRTTPMSESSGPLRAAAMARRNRRRWLAKEKQFATS
jgi:hypothetical protein